MSLKLKFATARIVGLIALIGFTAASESQAQRTPAKDPEQTVPLSNKETPGPVKPTVDKTKTEPEDFKEGAGAPRGAGVGRKPKGDAPEKPDKTAYDFELPGS